MKKIVYVCNKCKKEIGGGVLQIFPQYIDRITGDYEEQQPFDAQLGKHYCEECTHRALSLLAIPGAEVFVRENEDQDQQDDGSSEDDGEPDIDRPPEKKRLIKVRKLPPVRKYRGGPKAIDKNLVYADYLKNKGQKNLYKTLAAKYGCSPARVGQIVRELQEDIRRDS